MWLPPYKPTGIGMPLASKHGNEVNTGIKAINIKEFQFIQNPRDGTQNWEAPSDRVAPKQKKGKGLRSKYDLT